MSHSSPGGSSCSMYAEIGLNSLLCMTMGMNPRARLMLAMPDGNTVSSAVQLTTAPFLPPVEHISVAEASGS